MTAKEKALELVDSFYWEIEDDYKSKICALVAVDEVIEAARFYDMNKQR